MSNFLNSLPNRVEKQEGTIYLIKLDPNENKPEQNVCTQAQVKIATDKNWRILSSMGDEYKGS